jgi:hypothetical protein
MIKPVFYLNGKRIKEPVNYPELTLELNFDKDDPSYRGQVSTNRWELGLGDYKDSEDGTYEANEYIRGGLFLGTGVFEGISFDIALQDGNNPPENIFNGYLDLSTADITCNRISAEAIESGDIDWLNNVADSFTFEYLFEGLKAGEAGRITRSDFVSVPYIVEGIPNAKEATIIGLSLFSVVVEFIDQLQSTSEKVPELFLPNFGHIITFVLRIVTLILLIISMVVLIIQIIRTLVQFTKFHSAMYVYNLCEKGAEYLGFDKFVSESILETYEFSRLVLLPETYEQFSNDKDLGERLFNFSQSILGYLLAEDLDGRGYYRGTFGDLLRALKDMFNAKVVIENVNGERILRLETVDYVTSSTDFYQIPDIDKTDVPYKFNSDEFNSSYILSFVSDVNDKQAMNKWRGTEVQVITAPDRVNNISNVIKGNSKELRLPFSRGKRNTDETFLEKMASEYIEFVRPLVLNADQSLKALLPAIQGTLNIGKKFLRAISFVTGGNVQTPNTPAIPPFNLADIVVDLEDYIFRKNDALIMENEFVTTPKLLMMEPNYEQWKTDKVRKLHVRNDEVINSVYLYNRFHSMNSFVGERDPNTREIIDNGKHNQYKIYSIDKVHFCIEDYKNVKANNKILDSDGVTQAEVISLKWNVYNQTASITYKVNERYTKNLNETLIQSDGR